VGELHARWRLQVAAGGRDRHWQREVDLAHMQGSSRSSACCNGTMTRKTGRPHVPVAGSPREQLNIKCPLRNERNHAKRLRT
jgi:hypothetical protein